MSREKKVFPEFKVKAYRDLSQRWYVSFKWEGRWRKRYGNINTLSTYEERLAAAHELIEQLKEELPRQVTQEEKAARQYIRDNTYRWRKKTLQQYHTVCNSFFQFLGGRVVDAPAVAEYLDFIRQSKHPTTYNRYLTMLRPLLKAGNCSYLLNGYTAVRTEKTPARYFQPHQAKRLMDHFLEKDPELAMFVQFIYFCFIRPGELRHLKAGDILIEEEEIRVPGNISKNRKVQYVALPKAFINSLTFIYDLSPGDYLFPSPNDRSKPIGERTMYRRHQLILDKLNFGTGYTLYSWKHTGAVALAKTGKVSMKELQLQLRHHSLDETDKYLRQMGVKDLGRLRTNFPTIWE